MLQHKILALRGNEVGKPERRKILFFSIAPPFHRPDAPAPPRQ